MESLFPPSGKLGSALQHMLQMAVSQHVTKKWVLDNTLGERWEEALPPSLPNFMKAPKPPFSYSPPHLPAPPISLTASLAACSSRTLLLPSLGWSHLALSPSPLASPHPFLRVWSLSGSSVSASLAGFVDNALEDLKELETGGREV